MNYKCYECEHFMGFEFEDGPDIWCNMGCDMDKEDCGDFKEIE